MSTIRPYKNPSDQQRHSVATLAAAGLSLNNLSLRTGLTAYIVKRVMAEDGWPTLLESKRVALEQLMRGDL